MKDLKWLEQKGISVVDGKVGFNGSRIASGEDFEQIALRYGTPIWFTNGDRVAQNILQIQEQFKRFLSEVQINYAIKANFRPEVVRIAAENNAGADCVSPNEVRLALREGIPREKIIYTGTSVSDNDLRILLKNEVKINIDSLSQLRRLYGLLAQMECPRQRLSVRLNPNTGAGHNPDVITAGVRNEDGVPIKFGIEQRRIEAIVEEASRTLGVDTLHFHIGSGWLGDSLPAFRVALRNALDVYKSLQKYGVRNLDIGGGPGIPYHPSQKPFPWKDYARVIQEEIREAGVDIQKLILEPGRSVVGDTTVLLARVNTVERKNGVNHVYVDTNMGDLARPKLYHAYHHILNSSNPDGKLVLYCVDGNACETGDIFTQSKWDLKRGCTRPIPETKEGHVFAFLDAGAYGEAMGSNYCLRERPRPVVKYQGKLSVGKRQNLADMVR